MVHKVRPCVQAARGLVPQARYGGGVSLQWCQTGLEKDCRARDIGWQTLGFFVCYGEPDVNGRIVL
jgi:hypothetical protein